MYFISASVSCLLLWQITDKTTDPFCTICMWTEANRTPYPILLGEGGPRLDRKTIQKVGFGTGTAWCIRIQTKTFRNNLMLKRTLVPPQYASVRREAVAQIIRECRAMQSTSKDDIFRRGRTRIFPYICIFSQLARWTTPRPAHQDAKFIVPDWGI